jgi:uncharacterized membrane protein YfcA
VLGFYDGFFGPGTGTFWTLALVLVLGFELLRATAWTKWMNFTSNAWRWRRFWERHASTGWPGCGWGSGRAWGAARGAGGDERRGVGLIRPVFLGVVLVAATKLFWDGWVR